MPVRMTKLGEASRGRSWEFLFANEELLLGVLPYQPRKLHSAMIRQKGSIFEDRKNVELTRTPIPQRFRTTIPDYTPLESFGRSKEKLEVDRNPPWSTVPSFPIDQRARANVFAKHACVSILLTYMELRRPE